VDSPAFSAWACDQSGILQEYWRAYQQTGSAINCVFDNTIVQLRWAHSSPKARLSERQRGGSRSSTTAELGLAQDDIVVIRQLINEALFIGIKVLYALTSSWGGGHESLVIGIHHPITDVFTRSQILDIASEKRTGVDVHIPSSFESLALFEGLVSAGHGVCGERRTGVGGLTSRGKKDAISGRIVCGECWEAL
jgi:hypothetical protein